MGFLLVVVGSAVGLGNIWRFPYVAYKNGGGAFLVPYVIALMTIGIPLMILELGLGHMFRGSAPVAFSRIGRRFEALGWWMVTFVFVGIMMYYCVVISWCLNYLYFSFGLTWGPSADTFFGRSFLEVSSGPYDIGSVVWPVVIGLSIVWLINGFIAYKGVRRWVEAASKIMVPLLALIILILVVWSLQLPGSIEGVKVYLKPDWKVIAALGNPAMLFEERILSLWSDAFSQVFFSLSLGFGIIVAYASYLPQKANIKANALIVAVSDTLFAVAAGVVVFATIGHMSHLSGKPLNKVIEAGPGLAFVAYPEAIGALPFWRPVFGILFFASLIFAGITSSISVFETAASSLIDKFGWSRKKVAVILSLAGFSGGLIFSMRSGIYWLDLIDHILNSFGLLVAGLLEAIVIGWVYKARRLREHINLAAGATTYRPLTKLWDMIITIWIPLVLGFVVVLEVVRQIKYPYGGYKWIFIGPVGIGWLAMTVVIAMFFRSRGWRKPPAKELDKGVKA